MERSKYILVPVDGSNLAKSAIPFAQSLAGADGTILLLQVVSPSDPIRDNLGVSLVSKEMAGRWHVEEIQRELDDFAGTLQLQVASGITVNTAVVVGVSGERNSRGRAAGANRDDRHDQSRARCAWTCRIRQRR